VSKKDMSEVRVFVEPELKNKFKGKCVTQGKTMSDVIADFMDRYVKEDSQPKTND
jgi:hypothetical protein